MFNRVRISAKKLLHCHYKLKLHTKEILDLFSIQCKQQQKKHQNENKMHYNRTKFKFMKIDIILYRTLISEKDINENFNTLFWSGAK